MLIIYKGILGHKTSFTSAWTSFPDSLQKGKELIQMFGVNRDKRQECAARTSTL